MCGKGHILAASPLTINWIIGRFGFALQHGGCSMNQLASVTPVAPDELQPRKSPDEIDE